MSPFHNLQYDIVVYLFLVCTNMIFCLHYRRKYHLSSSSLKVGCSVTEKQGTNRYALVLQSVPLWLDYLNFVQEHCSSVRECSPDGISKARSLFERALTAAGLHVAEGNKIWEAFREFEQAIYYTINDSDSDVRTHLLLLGYLML